MRKIPTLFLRDPADRARVLPEVHPDCQWVLDGDGHATRKFDGTCILLDEANQWWARRQVNPGTPEPDGFQAVQLDDETGKVVGWEPVKLSPFRKIFQDLVESHVTQFAPPGTYELCGPQINGNPDGFTAHVLIAHDQLIPLPGVPRTYADLAAYLPGLYWEGVVWHHPDGRRAKLKRRDFPPLPETPTP